jgi:DNA helicase IV
MLGHLGKPAAAVHELDIGYRVPREILDYASRLLPLIAPGLAAAVSLRADPEALAVVRVSSAELGLRVAAACSAALAGPGSVAVICADAQVDQVKAALAAAGVAFGLLGGDPADSGAADEGHSAAPAAEIRLTIVPVTLAKGLEFDHVVLVEPAAIAVGEAYGLRRLYVALTRAVSRLTVFHADPLPEALALRTMN